MFDVIKKSLLRHCREKRNGRFTLMSVMPHVAPRQFNYHGFVKTTWASEQPSFRRVFDLQHFRYSMKQPNQNITITMMS